MSLKVDSSTSISVISSPPSVVGVEESIGARVAARHGRRVRGMVDEILPGICETKRVKQKKVLNRTCVHIKETSKGSGEGIAVAHPKETPAPPLPGETKPAQGLPQPLVHASAPLLVRTNRITSSVFPSREKEVTPQTLISLTGCVKAPVVAAANPLLGVAVPEKQKCLGLVPNLVPGVLIGAKDPSGVFRFVEYVRTDESNQDWILCKEAQGEKRVRRFGCISVKNTSDPLPQEPLGEEVPDCNLSAHSVGNDLHVHDVVAVQSIIDSGGIFRYVQYLGKTGRSIPSLYNPTKMEETIWYTDTDERMRFELPAHMFRVLKTPVMLKSVAASLPTGIQRVRYGDLVPQSFLAMSIRRLEPKDVVAFHQEKDPENVYRYVTYLGPASKIQGGFLFSNGSENNEAPRSVFRSLNVPVTILPTVVRSGPMCNPTTAHIDPIVKTPPEKPVEQQRKIEDVKQPARWVKSVVDPEGDLQALSELNRKGLFPFDLAKFDRFFPTLRKPVYAVGLQVLSSVQNIYDFFLHVYATNKALFEKGVSLPEGPLDPFQEIFWKMLQDIHKENS